jgi:hypothetical protein
LNDETNLKQMCAEMLELAQFDSLIDSSQTLPWGSGCLEWKTISQADSQTAFLLTLAALNTLWTHWGGYTQKHTPESTSLTVILHRTFLQLQILPKSRWFCIPIYSNSGGALLQVAQQETYDWCKDSSSIAWGTSVTHPSHTSSPFWLSNQSVQLTVSSWKTPSCVASLVLPH